MSINRNRAKLNKAKNNAQWRRLWFDELYPPWSEDYGMLLSGLWPKQYRAYRTWKHNRNTQWKE